MLVSLRDYKSGEFLYPEFIGYDPCVGVKIGKLVLNWEEYCKAVLFVFLQVSKQKVPEELQRVLLWLQVHPGYGKYILAKHTEQQNEEKITAGSKEFILSVNENQDVVFGPYLLNLNEFCLVTHGFISGKEEEGYREMPPPVCNLREQLPELFKLLPDQK